ncbi:MAG: hypothetical protein IPH86_03390 [bacterium]|nr:hypothetical protein [bacterium]
MEVVPTGDGDDDGVVWFRCPQCQGFLPKLSSAVEVNPVAADAADGDDDDSAAEQAGRHRRRTCCPPLRRPTGRYPRHRPG